MKTYSKRIAFLISDQHLIPHGGLGSFAKSFTEMCNRINWKVDLVLDKKPTNEFAEVVEQLGAGIVYNTNSVQYTEHTGTFAFSDSINFERIVNFRKSIIKAFESNCYDMIVCNTQEAMTSVYCLHLGEYIPIVFYTHQPSMVTRENDSKDVFLKPYHDFYNKHLEFPDICVGTQSQRNKNNLNKYGANNVYVLPMPMSERDLLTQGPQVREGVLYIGRWEPRKNPEAFLKVMAECKLPVRVMTNRNGAIKFKKELDKLGITDYVIKSEIYGQEKVDFIKGCKVHFNPSYSENYPFVFFECLAHMHCVVLDTQDWADNFDSKYYHVTKMKDTSKLITDLHNKDIPLENLNYIKSLDDNTDQAWVDFVNNFSGKKSSSDAAKINNVTTTSYADFIKSLARTHLAQEDIVSILGNRHKFNVIYTDKDTWISKDKDFVPEENESLLEFG
jgi:glycosyltransferase involved in cell wall biosynthesis